MIRLTTPVHSFIVDYDPADWVEFRITYKQKDFIILELTQDDVTHGDVEGRIDIKTIGEKYELSFRLTQEETSRFRSDQPVKIQIRCLFEDGTALASEMMDMSVRDVLNQEILGDET